MVRTTDWGDVAELVFTTDAFRPLGLPAPGVPVLLDGGMRLVEPACAWLMHVALARGRTRSPGAPAARRSTTGGKRWRPTAGRGTG